MKGRRKSDADKWMMKANYDNEARRSMKSRTEAKNRFLNAAFQSPVELEPAGWLAGQPKATNP